MKKYFYIALLGLVIFEVLRVYFIMPMPGSQTMNSLSLAYFLHTWRWFFRLLFVTLLIAGSVPAFRVKHKWLPVLAFIFTAAIVYMTNFIMSADKMFLQTHHVVLKPQAENKVPGSRVVIGIVNNGQAKAYPVELLTYHHQVLDSLGGKPVMVTYCSVCRTGRVYEPMVDGHYEKFRLVGMDHFNAMFEDAATGSWWRQVSGEAVTGSLKGKLLPEMESAQMTVDEWFRLYPDGQVMQPDEDFLSVYDPEAKFEQGKSKSSLTGTDSQSWQKKSWVVGIQLPNAYKAYDWNDLKAQMIINDIIDKTSVVLALAPDGQSFVAFERPAGTNFTLSHDTLFADNVAYNFSGQALNAPAKLKKLKAYQEFWHSWANFHPATQQYRSTNP